jgi:hypothetical protein
MLCKWGDFEEANGRAAATPKPDVTPTKGQPVEFLRSNTERVTFMRKICSMITVGIMSAGLIHAAKKFPFTASSIVPAAKGSVEVGKDRNGNTEVELKVEHLANPTSLSPSQANYIVWLQEKGSGPENQGELKVNGKLQGSFRTVTPRKNFELFVTGENDGTVKMPSGPEVLRTSVSR